jgi:hypothetical protein
MAQLRTTILLAALSTGLTFGGTIISDLCCGGTSGSTGGSFAVTWTETGSYNNVMIGANLVTSNGLSTSTGLAYLLTAIGPSADASDEVVAPFSISVIGNPGVNTMTTLFSGVTLGPGTYYLAIVPTSVNQSNSLDWDETGVPVQVLDTGVTQGSDESLAGSFNSAETASAGFHNFLVTGTPATQSTTPEPATTVMMLGGLAGFAIVQRMRK